MRRLITAAITAMILSTASVVPVQAQGDVVATSSTPTSSGAAEGNLRAVQMTLYAHGYNVRVTGKYDVRTTRAISAWQRANGLRPTGKVNPATLRSLGLVDVAKLPKVTPKKKKKSPAPPSTPSSGSYVSPHPEVQRWYSTAMSVGWRDNEWPRLACIIWRESRGEPTIANSAGAVGLTQILYRAHASWLGGVGPEQLKDPVVNLTIARRLYEAAGWNPWYYPPKPC